MQSEKEIRNPRTTISLIDIFIKLLW